MHAWLVTGGAGFIGANFVLAARRLNVARIINLDLLTYAGHPENLAAWAMAGMCSCMVISAIRHWSPGC
jgi:dTDP-D-glucose 4,6-dehydratase